MGVASLSKKSGIHEFNKKSAYNDWLFIYDPAQDRGQLLRGPYNPQAFVGQVDTNVAGTSPAGGTPRNDEFARGSGHGHDSGNIFVERGDAFVLDGNVLTGNPPQDNRPATSSRVRSKSTPTSQQRA